MHKADFHYQLVNTLNIASQMIIKDSHYQKTSCMIPKGRKYILFHLKKQTKNFPELIQL